MVDSQIVLRRPRAQAPGPVYVGSAVATGLQPGLVKSQPTARPPARYSNGVRAGSPAPRPTESPLQATAAESLATIERALENINNLQGSIGFYKEMVTELRTCLDEERRHLGDAHAQIGSLERLVATERERALAADKRAAQAETAAAELRSQLAANQTETMRLVTAIQALTSLHVETSANVVDYKARRAA